MDVTNLLESVINDYDGEIEACCAALRAIGTAEAQSATSILRRALRHDPFVSHVNFRNDGFVEGRPSIVHLAVLRAEGTEFQHVDTRPGPISQEQLEAIYDLEFPSVLRLFARTTRGKVIRQAPALIYSYDPVTRISTPQRKYPAATQR